MFSILPKCCPLINILRLGMRAIVNQINKAGNLSMLLNFWAQTTIGTTIGTTSDVRWRIVIMQDPQVVPHQIRAHMKNTCYQPFQDFKIELSINYLSRWNKLMMHNALRIEKKKNSKRCLHVGSYFFRFFCCSLRATFISLNVSVQDSTPKTTTNLWL